MYLEDTHTHEWTEVSFTNLVGLLFFSFGVLTPTVAFVTTLAGVVFPFCSRDLWITTTQTVVEKRISHHLNEKLGTPKAVQWNEDDCGRATQ